MFNLNIGWDGINFGYGVTTALMIVHWLTAFLPGPMMPAMIILTMQTMIVFVSCLP